MHQFIHVESYAKTPSTQKKPSIPKTKEQAIKAKLKSQNAPAKDKKWGVKDILDEALRREPEACKHVLVPNMKPNFIIGTEEDFSTLERKLDSIVEKVRAQDKRKAQADTHILLSGVASFPREVYETEPELYEKWKEKTLDFLKEKYGSNLYGVIEHLDERHPHMHFYCINEQSANVKFIHEGHIAQSKANPPGQRVSKAGTEAFKKAMEDFQTDYHQSVGLVIGMTRDGPKRQRLTAVENAARKDEARQQARDIENISKSCVELMLENSKVDSRKSNITEHEYEFHQYKKAEEKRLREMEEELNTVYQMKNAEISSREKKLAQGEKELEYQKIELARRDKANQLELARRENEMDDKAKEYYRLTKENEQPLTDYTIGFRPEDEKKSATRADDLSWGS